MALCIAGPCVASGFGFRVCERVSRHGKCRSDGHLYPFFGSQHRRCLVRFLEFLRRGDVNRCGGVWHRLLAAGGTDPASRRKRRLCHGLRTFDRRHHVESRHLVVWAARFEFAHLDRLHHRSRHRQPIDECKKRHQRRRLGASRQHRQVPAALANLRFPSCLAAVYGDEGGHQGQSGSTNRRKARNPRHSGFAACSF